MMPDELIEKTGAEGAMSSYNEVVLDRLAGDKYGGVHVLGDK